MRRRLGKTLIFYQSISNIDYVIHILKKSKKNTCIIIITGGKHFLEIIDKLKLKKKFGVELIDFSQPNITKPFNILKFLFKIEFGNALKNLKKKNISKAYFNCYNTDYVTTIFLSLLNIQKIYFCKYKSVKVKKEKNHYPANFKWIVKIMILKIILLRYKISVKYCGNDGFRRVYFKAINKKIIEINLPFLNLSKNYLIPLNLSSYKRYVIFLDSNQESFIGKKYFITINQMFEIFKKYNFDIIIKKKPGISLSNSFKKIDKKNIITSNVPIEFYNLNKINVLVGISSTGQTQIANRNSKITVISCLFLFFNYKSKINENVKNLKHIINFLKTRDLYKRIFFPKNIIDVEKKISIVSKLT